jgi:hypothetical protein
VDNSTDVAASEHAPRHAAEVINRPLRGSEALALGLLTEDRLYGPRFRRLFPDVYLPAEHALDLATRSRVAYLLVRERGGVLAGYSAAHLLGADCAPRHAPRSWCRASTGCGRGCG